MTWLVSDEDRKELLKYLSRRPYIEVAPLVGMLAQWKKNNHPHTHPIQDKTGDNHTGGYLYNLSLPNTPKYI